MWPGFSCESDGIATSGIMLKVATLWIHSDLQVGWNHGVVGEGPVPNLQPPAAIAHIALLARRASSATTRARSGKGSLRFSPCGLGRVSKAKSDGDAPPAGLAEVAAPPRSGTSPWP
jgi:hypothetical protein